ncbi:hypothetical protein EQG49_03890 [Periweissella cryptocerci]|uniref:Uncharacterized protein n=1 Tax=Periweissella cryptocerci TaxID=2506420 RepID=A0A4P6YSH2_9LACO|nr:hypothetical protein [Periweissella cryptocerci]QBO35659.1 hypothetical protein EQG49_03890 [Periweissella cryptocerci]
MTMLVAVTEPKFVTVGNVVSEFAWQHDGQIMAQLQLAQMDHNSLEATVVSLSMENERAGHELLKAVMRYLELTDYVVESFGPQAKFYQRIGFDLRQVINFHHQTLYTLTYDPINWEK